MRVCKNGHDLDEVGESKEIDRHGKPRYRCKRCRADKEIERRRLQGVGPRIVTPDIERFLKLTNKSDKCWLWAGYTTPDGYGRFGSSVAHRFSYQFYKGGIPEGYEIDHTCSIRNCVNPEHLDAVTPQENIRRAVERGSYKNHTHAGEAKAAKTHCPKGHPYLGDNLYIDTHSGGRRCKTCMTEQRNKR